MEAKKFCPYCGEMVIEKSFGNRKHGYCQKCDIIHYENPLPAVAALVLDQKNQLLLVKRSVEPGKGEWCLPGGFLEIDESIEEAVLRELEEETGIKGEIEGLIDFFSQKSRHYRAILIFGYKVKILGGEVKAGDDADDAGFFCPDALPPIAFLSHQQLIEKGFSDMGIVPK